jgi:N6-adenosine-specific RNA methylase IME4
MRNKQKAKALSSLHEAKLSATVLQDRVVKILNDSSRNLLIAVTIPQHKLIADIAAAQEVFSTRQRLGEDVIGYAHALKVEALAGLGDLLKKQPRATGRSGPGRGKAGTKAGPAFSDAPTLADLGIDKKTSSLAQRLASLSDAERNAIASRDKTLAEVTRTKTATARAVRLALPDAKYRVIYADPPWAYRDGVGVSGSVQCGPGAAMQYPTMAIEELCALDVQAICDDDAVLFLWVTSPLLFECQPVITAWGFSYRASFVWDKVKHNHGHYNSVRHEFLLVCVRGSGVPDVPTQPDSVQVIERTGHSEKPERFRELIDELYPTGKRVELFARIPPSPPWEGWGDEL